MQTALSPHPGHHGDHWSWGSLLQEGLAPRPSSDTYSSFLFFRTHQVCLSLSSRACNALAEQVLQEVSDGSWLQSQGLVGLEPTEA